MHAYVVMRGIKDRQDRVVNDLLARHYPYKCGEVAGKPVVGMLQLAVRPIQLYELTFPEEAEAQVLGAIQPYGGYGMQTPLPKKLLIWLRWIVSKITGYELEEMPVHPRNSDYLNTEGVDIWGLGIKRDKPIPVTREDI